VTTMNHEADTDCRCRATLIDWVQLTVSHPYTACPYHGQTTPLPDTHRSDVAPTP
jgi:hypothetical protein